MRTASPVAKLCYIYLCCVPILTTVFGFVTGHISPKIYVPIWLLNLVLMGFSIRVLGAGAFQSGDMDKRHLAVAGCLLVLPIGLLAILFGIGPPPGSREEWVSTALEQKVRFDAILAGGIFTALGLSLVKVVLVDRGEKMFSQLGLTSILISLPLFLIVTAFWHSFALEAFKQRVQNPTAGPMEWYRAATAQLWVVTICEIVLTYVAIVLFARALRITGIFCRAAGIAYISIGIVAIVAVLCYPLIPGSEPFSGFPYYPFMIPAVPMTVGYYMGFNLVRAAGRG
jgi:hypothetical protein